MIILIGGETHAGKTVMAQSLMEAYKIPYTSLDHIKMGLFRSGMKCGFTPTDSDSVISDNLWGVIKGIINTCRENCQSIILEGCYLPAEKVTKIKDSVIPLYIILSERYINDNIAKIIKHESDIEKRLICGDFSPSELIENNRELKRKCLMYGLPFVEIEQDYEREIQDGYSYISRRIAMTNARA